MKIPKTTMPKLSKSSEKFDILAHVEKQETNKLSFNLDFSIFDTEEISPQQVASLTLAQKNKLSPRDYQIYSYATSGYTTITENDKYHLSEGRDFHTLRFIKEKIDNDSFFMTIKEFGESGQIRSKYLEYNHGPKVGIGYEYDDQGELIREIDYEEGYGFKFKDVLTYLIKKEIKTPVGFRSNQGPNPEIEFIEENGKKMWKITYRKFTDYLYFITDVLDGQSGELVRTSSEEFEPFTPPEGTHR